MTTENLIQGSAEWHQARCGSLGASSIADAIARTKSGWGASRSNLLARLVVERLTGVPAESYINDAMIWGMKTEPQARAAYSFFRDAAVTEVGLIVHPTIGGTHASPDGLVGIGGLLELKCPTSATHIATLMSKAVPDKYVVQMQWQMACTRRQWADYASFDPRFPVDLQLFVERLPRDNRRITELEAQVREFLAEVDTTIAELKGRGHEHLTDKLRASLAEPSTILGAG